MIKDDRKTSKFRNLYGQGAVRKTEMYEGLRVSQHQSENCPLSVNPKWMAISIQSEGGGTFVTLPIFQKGRVDDLRLPHFNGHSKPVVEMAWNPFDDDVIATGSEDAIINIWNVGNPHVDVHHYCDPKRALLLSLQRHDKRINCITWHPAASNILATASSDARAIIWNVETGQAFKTIVDFKDAVWDVAWNYNGSLLAATCKDRVLRIIDPRRGTIAKEVRSHQGIKGSKVFFVDKDPYGSEQHYMITTGFSKMSERQIAVWDQRKLREPLSLDMIDSSPGALFPFFDQETGILYVGGKGDGSIKFYEFRAASVSPSYTTHFSINSSHSGSSEYYSDAEEHRKSSRFAKTRNKRSPSHQLDQHHLLSFLGSFQTSIPQTSLCAMPKRGLDTSICEVFRFYKLRATATAANNVNIIEPISMIVPRKSVVYQEDLYPPTASPRPALQAAEWIGGKNSSPLLVSLKNFAGVYTEEPPPKPGQKPLSQLGVLKSNFLMRGPVPSISVEANEEEEEELEEGINNERSEKTSPKEKSIEGDVTKKKAKRSNRHHHHHRDYYSDESRSGASEDDYEENTESVREADDNEDNSLQNELPTSPSANVFGSEDEAEIPYNMPLNLKNISPEKDEQVKEDIRKLREKKLKAYQAHRERVAAESEKDENVKEGTVYKGKLTLGGPHQQQTNSDLPPTGIVRKRVAAVIPRQRGASTEDHHPNIDRNEAAEGDRAPYFMSLTSASKDKQIENKRLSDSSGIRVVRVESTLKKSPKGATLAKPEDSQSPPLSSELSSGGSSATPSPEPRDKMAPVRPPRDESTASKIQKMALLSPPPQFSQGGRSPTLSEISSTASSPFAHQKSPTRTQDSNGGKYNRSSLTVPSGEDEDERYFSDYKDYESPNGSKTTNRGSAGGRNLRRQNSFSKNTNYKAFFRAADEEANRKKTFDLTLGGADEDEASQKLPGSFSAPKKKTESMKVAPTTQKTYIDTTPGFTGMNKGTFQSKSPPPPTTYKTGLLNKAQAPPPPPARNVTANVLQTSSPNIHKVSYAAVPPLIVNSSSPAYPRKNLVSTLLSHELSPPPKMDSHTGSHNQRSSSVHDSIHHIEEGIQKKEQYPPGSVSTHQQHPYYHYNNKQQQQETYNPYQHPSYNTQRKSNPPPTSYIDETLALCNQLREENRSYRTEIGLKNRRIIELENEVTEKNKHIKNLEVELGFDRMPPSNSKHGTPSNAQRSSYGSISSSGPQHRVSTGFPNHPFKTSLAKSSSPPTTAYKTFPARLTSLTDSVDHHYSPNYNPSLRLSSRSSSKGAPPAFLIPKSLPVNAASLKPVSPTNLTNAPRFPIPTPPSTSITSSSQFGQNSGSGYLNRPKYILPPLRKYTNN